MPADFTITLTTDSGVWRATGSVDAKTPGAAPVTATGNDRVKAVLCLLNKLVEDGWNDAKAEAPAAPEAAK